MLSTPASGAKEWTRDLLEGRKGKEGGGRRGKEEGKGIKRRFGVWMFV